MELPDFDYLVTLAKEQPEEFEALRQRHNQHLIDSVTAPQKRRLEGLLFKINMHIRRSKNATQSCIKLSQLMMNSLSDMQETLVESPPAAPVKQVVVSNSANNIINFPLKDALPTPA